MGVRGALADTVPLGLRLRSTTVRLGVRVGEREAERLMEKLGLAVLQAVPLGGLRVPVGHWLLLLLPLPLALPAPLLPLAVPVAVGHWLAVSAARGEGLPPRSPAPPAVLLTLLHTVGDRVKDTDRVAWGVLLGLLHSLPLPLGLPVREVLRVWLGELVKLALLQAVAQAEGLGVGERGPDTECVGDCVREGEREGQLLLLLLPVLLGLGLALPEPTPPPTPPGLLLAPPVGEGGVLPL